MGLFSQCYAKYILEDKEKIYGPYDMYVETCKKAIQRLDNINMQNKQNKKNPTKVKGLEVWHKPLFLSRELIIFPDWQTNSEEAANFIKKNYYKMSCTL